MAHGTCSIDGCDTVGTVRRGLCDTHYARLLRHGSPDGSAWGDVEARIRAKTDVQDDGCWVYTGQPSARYPEVRIDGIRVGIHRWSYEQHHGPIPDSHHVDHMCRNTRCWNPDHLRTLTAYDNSADNIHANRRRQATHCANGHEYTPDNVYRSPSEPSRRYCRTCRIRKKVV